jgi:hypothetical protein
LVKKEYKVSRVEIGLVRLGRYPAGTLVENRTNKNSGTLPQIEQMTAWLRSPATPAPPPSAPGRVPASRSAGPTDASAS